MATFDFSTNSVQGTGHGIPDPTGNISIMTSIVLLLASLFSTTVQTNPHMLSMGMNGDVVIFIFGLEGFQYISTTNPAIGWTSVTENTYEEPSTQMYYYQAHNEAIYVYGYNGAYYSMQRMNWANERFERSPQEQEEVIAINIHFGQAVVLPRSLVACSTN